MVIHRCNGNFGTGKKFCVPTQPEGHAQPPMNADLRREEEVLVSSLKRTLVKDKMNTSRK